MGAVDARWDPGTLREGRSAREMGIGEMKPVMMACGRPWVERTGHRGANKSCDSNGCWLGMGGRRRKRIEAQERQVSHQPSDRERRGRGNSVGGRVEVRVKAPPSERPVDSSNGGAGFGRTRATNALKCEEVEGSTGA